MRIKRSDIRRWTTAYLFLLPTLIVMGVFIFYPVVQAFLLSLYNVDFVFEENTLFLGREWVGLSNFRELWYDRAFWSALTNSFLYLLVVPVIIVLSLGLAMLVEPQIPFIGFFRAAFYVPVVTMMVVVALVWKLIFDTDVGALNQMLLLMGMVDEGVPWLTSESIALFTVMSVTVWKGLGYYMVLFIVALRAVPEHLKEAATIDGARRWQVFLHVTLPSIWPTMSLVAILSCISALKVFDEILVMTNGRVGTETMVFEIFRTGFPSGDFGDMDYACTMGVVLFAILFVFTAISTRMSERAYSSG